MARRTETHTELIETTIVDSKFVQCNLCGREWQTKSPEGQECIYLEFTGGYHSRFFGDCSLVRLDICEECAWEMAGDCVVPPETKLGGILAHRDDGEWKPLGGNSNGNSVEHTTQEQAG